MEGPGERARTKPAAFPPPHNPIVAEFDPLLAPDRVVEESVGEWERWGTNKMFEQDTNSGYDGVTFYATLRTTAPLNDTQTTLQVLGLTSYQKPSNGWTSLKNLGFNKT